MNHLKQLQKFISSIIVVTFFVTNTLIPAPVAHAMNVESPEFIPSFKIPAEFGKITDSVKGPAGSPLIIHIQEAHANYDAQKNIRNILGLLVQHYGVRRIFVEGAGYKLKPGFFKFFPEEPNLQQTVNERLMQAGELTGAEVFLMEQEGATRNAQRTTEKQNSLSVERSTLSTLEAWGVETAEAYAKNRQAFKQTFEGRRLADRYLETTYLQWQKTASLSPNKSLREFLNRETSYEEKRFSLTNWMDFLKTKAAQSLKLDLTNIHEQKDWPVLVRYFRLKTLEGKIDQAKTDKEKAAFLTNLKERSIPEALIQEIARFFEHENSGDLPLYQTRFTFEKLMDLLPENYSFAAYPNVRLLIQQRILLSEVQGDALQAEIKELTGKLTHSFIKTEEDGRLVKALHDYRLLKKLFYLELSRKEYEELKLAQGAKYKAQGKDFELCALNFAPKIKELFSSAMDFYEGAIEREAGMMEKTLSYMREQKQTKAVLITGGFHTEGLKEKTLKAGSSYIGITPRIGEITADSEKNYLEALLGRRTVQNSQIAALRSVSDGHFLREVNPKNWRRELAGVGVRGLNILESVPQISPDKARMAVSHFLKTAISQISGPFEAVPSTARSEIREEPEIVVLKKSLMRIIEGTGKKFALLKPAESRDFREGARFHKKNLESGASFEKIASAENFLTRYRGYANILRKTGRLEVKNDFSQKTSSKKTRTAPFNFTQNNLNGFEGLKPSEFLDQKGIDFNSLKGGKVYIRSKHNGIEYAITLWDEKNLVVPVMIDILAEQSGVPRIRDISSIRAEKTSSRSETRSTERLDKSLLIDAKLLALDWTGTIFDKEKNALMPGIRTLLETARAQRVPAVIITYNKKTDILAKLEELKIAGLVDDVRGIDQAPGGTKNVKTYHLENLLREHRLTVNQIVTIGDQPKDILEGREARVVTVAFTSQEKLETDFKAPHQKPHVWTENLQDPDLLTLLFGDGGLNSSRSEMRATEAEAGKFTETFFNVKMDKQNRIVIPIEWRELLGNQASFKALPEEDGNKLRVYPYETWEEILLDERPKDPVQARKHDDKYYSAISLTPDDQGRVVLSRRKLNPKFLNASGTYLLKGVGDSFLISPIRAKKQSSRSRSEVHLNPVDSSTSQSAAMESRRSEVREETKNPWEGITTPEERTALRDPINKEIDSNGSVIYEVNARQLFQDKKHKDPTITNLWDAITDEDLDRFRDSGANVLWLMGVWKTGEFSEKFNKAWEETEGPGRVASAYSIDDYVINPVLGDEAAFRRLVIRANRKGLKVILDFIPNHMAADSVWIQEHPDWFIQDDNPYAYAISNLTDYLVSGPNGFSATFLGRGLDLMPNFSIYIEKLKRSLKMAHGRGGLEVNREKNKFPWIDTAQLDINHPDVQAKFEEVLSYILDITNGGGVRVDMAHYTLKEHVNSAWLGPLGKTLMERGIWRGMITKLRASHPGALFVAEAYGESEGSLQAVGINATYDKYEWELLKGIGTVPAIMKHLTQSSIEYLRKAVHFLENHDDPPEKRIANLMSPEQETAALAIISAASPGSILLYDGQLEGHSKGKPSANWLRSPDVEETVNSELLERSRKLLKVTNSALFRKAKSEWPPAKDLEMSQGVLAVQRKFEGDFALVVVNYSPDPGKIQYAPDVTQWGISEKEAFRYEWKDLLTGDTVPLDHDLTLEPWEYRILVLKKKELPHRTAAKDRAKARAATAKLGIEAYTVVSSQLEAGLDRGILEALNKKLSGRFPDLGTMIRRYVGLVAETTLTGGLGALMHDLFPAWAKNLGSQKKQPKDLIAVNAIYEEIKGQQYARYLPDEIKEGETTLGDYLRSVLTRDRSLDFSFGLEIGDDFRRKAVEEEAWAERGGFEEFRLAMRKAQQIIGRRVHVEVYPTETYYNQAPNYYIDAYFHDEKGEKVRIFDSVYPDVPQEDHPNLWRDVHMAVYSWAKQHLVQKLQEKGVAKDKILFVDNEVFVSTPTPMFPDAIHHHINHTVFRPGLYMPDEASYEMLGYPEILRKYIVKNGRIDVINAVGVSSNLITGVALYEHTEVLADDIMAAYPHKLVGYNENGIRNTNGILLEQWQSPFLRRLINRYKQQLGLQPEASEKDFFKLISAAQHADALEAFKQKAEFVKAAGIMDLLLWLKEDQDFAGWFDEVVTAYKEKTRAEKIDDQKLIEDFQRAVELAVEDPEAWQALIQREDLVFLKEFLLKNPILANARRQVAYKGPDKWIEILEKLKSDLQALAKFKTRAPRVIIGGREFGKKDHGMFLRIQALIGELGLQDRIATIEDYNIYIAPIIARGVSGAVMLSDEKLEAASTFMMKVLANGGPLVGVWGGAVPELFKITNVETGQEINIFRDKVTYDQLVSKVKEGLWKIKNGFLIEYSATEWSTLPGGGRRPSADSLLQDLYDLNKNYQDPQERRDLQFEALATTPKVDMAAGQALALKMLWKRTIRILQEGEELFENLDVSMDDAKLFLEKSLAQAWQPEFYWHNTTQDAGNIRGILGFIEGFRYLRMKGRESYNSIAYHAMRGEKGDIFAYLDKFFQGFDATLTPLIQKISELSERAQKTQSVRERVEANLQALEIVEKLTVKISVDLFENYVRTQDKSLEEYLALPVVRENIAIHLERNAVPFESLAKKIRGYSVDLDGQKYLVALNLGEYVFQGVKGGKAWGALYGRKASEDLAGSNDETKVYSVLDVISGTKYGKYPLWKIAESISVGAPFPGIQVMKLVDTGEKSDEHEASLRDSVVNYLVALTKEGRLVSDEKPITQLLFQKIKDGIENPAKMSRLLSGVTRLSRDEAISKFGKEGIPSVMAFVTMLAPGRLEAMKDWDPEVYDKLLAVIQQPHFKDLFKNGKIWFHRVDRDSAIVISRNLPDRNGLQLFMPIHFSDAPFRPWDGKAWFRVLDIDNLGIQSSKTAKYQVRNVLLNTLYPLEHSGEDLVRDKWPIGVALKEPEDSSALREPLYRFQILEIIPTSAAMSRSEVRGNGIERVLIVDDREIDRGHSRGLVEGWATARGKVLKIREVSSDENPLEILETQRATGKIPDLVFVGRQRPGMNGMMLVQAIHEKGIPVKAILVTGAHSHGKDMKEFRKSLIHSDILVGMAKKSDQYGVEELLDQMEASLTARSEMREEPDAQESQENLDGIGKESIDGIELARTMRDAGFPVTFIKEGMGPEFMSHLIMDHEAIYLAPELDRDNNYEAYENRLFKMATAEIGPALQMVRDAEFHAHKPRQRKIFILRGMVNPGTSKLLYNTIKWNAHPADSSDDLDFDVVFQPDFTFRELRNEKTIEPMVVFGLMPGKDKSFQDATKEVLNRIHGQFYKESKIQFMNIRSAEMAKEMLLVYLGAKLAHFDDVAELSRAYGADLSAAAFGAGLDKRIRTLFTNPSLGFGGRLYVYLKWIYAQRLYKATVELEGDGSKEKCNLTEAKVDAAVAKLEKGVDFSEILKELPRELQFSFTLKNILNVNRQNIMDFHNTIAREYEKFTRNSLRGKKVALLSVGYRSQSGQITDSPALLLIERLVIDYGIGEFYIAGPVAKEAFQKWIEKKSEKISHLRSVKFDFVDNIYSAIQQADLAIIPTDSNSELKVINIPKLAAELKGKPLFDGINLFGLRADGTSLYRLKDVRDVGIHLFGVGRLPLGGSLDNDTGHRLNDSTVIHTSEEYEKAIEERSLPVQEPVSFRQKTVTMIGGGYVGLVTAANLAAMGHKVHVVDIKAKQKEIDELNSPEPIVPIYEPGLREMIIEGKRKGLITFSTDLEPAVRDSSIVYLAVGTPSQETGEVDLAYILKASADVGDIILKYGGSKAIVIKSTVTPDTFERMDEVLKAKGLKLGKDYMPVSNPEFLREGQAIEDVTQPDRTVLGFYAALTPEDRKRAEKELLELWYPLMMKHPHAVLLTDAASSTIIKYLANSFLAIAITLSNIFAANADQDDADFMEIRAPMLADPRIGKNAFLSPGAGYGGSCFPKDVLALHFSSRKSTGHELPMISIATGFNDYYKKNLVARTIRRVAEFPKAENPLKGKKIVMLGMAFKADTDDMREASSIYILRELLKKGAEQVTLHDPILSMPNAPASETKINDFLDVFYKTFREDANFQKEFGTYNKVLAARDEPIIQEQEFFKRVYFPEKFLKTGRVIFEKNFENLGQADIVFLVTEWEQYRDISFEAFKKPGQPLAVIDGRNLYYLRRQELSQLGSYMGIGTAWSLRSETRAGEAAERVRGNESESVLIVDDNKNERNQVLHLLEDWAKAKGKALKIQKTSSAEEALRILRRQQATGEIPDLVVAANRLAGMSGLDLARAIHKERIPVKVALVTGMLPAEEDMELYKKILVDPGVLVGMVLKSDEDGIKKLLDQVEASLTVRSRLSTLQFIQGHAQSGIHRFTGSRKFEKLINSESLTTLVREIMHRGFAYPAIDDLETLRLIQGSPDPHSDIPIGFFVEEGKRDSVGRMFQALTLGAASVIGLEGFSVELSRKIRKDFPEAVQIEGIKIEGPDAVKFMTQVDKAVVKNVDGIILLNYYNNSGQPVLSPETLSGLKAKYPNLVVILAKNVTPERAKEVLSLPAQVTPALALDPGRSTLKELIQQLDEFSQAISQTRLEIQRSETRAVEPAIALKVVRQAGQVRTELPYGVQYKDQIYVVKSAKWFDPRSHSRTFGRLTGILSGVERGKKPVLLRGISMSSKEDDLFSTMGFVPVQNRKDVERQTLIEIVEKIKADRNAEFNQQGNNLTVTANGKKRLFTLAKGWNNSATFRTFIWKKLKTRDEWENGIKSFEAKALTQGALTLRDPVQVVYVLNDLEALAKKVGLEPAMVKSGAITQAEYNRLEATRPIEKVSVKPVVEASGELGEVLNAAKTNAPSPEVTMFREILSGINKAWQEREDHWAIQRVREENIKNRQRAQSLKGLAVTAQETTKTVEKKPNEFSIPLNFENGTNELSVMIEQMAKENESESLFNNPSYKEILRLEDSIKKMLRTSSQLNAKELRTKIEQVFSAVVRLQTLIRTQTHSFRWSTVLKPRLEMLYFLAKDIMQLRAVQEMTGIITAAKDKELTDFVMRVIGGESRLTVVNEPSGDSISNAHIRDVERDAIQKDISELQELIIERKVFYDRILLDGQSTSFFAETVGRMYVDVSEQLEGLRKVGGAEEFVGQLFRALDILVTLWASDAVGLWLKGTKESPMPEATRLRYRETMDRLLRPIFLRTSEEVDAYLFGREKTAPANRSETRTAPGEAALTTTLEMNQFIKTYNESLGGGKLRGFRGVTEKITDGIWSLMAHTLNAVELIASFFGGTPTQEIQEMQSSALAEPTTSLGKNRLVTARKALRIPATISAGDAFIIRPGLAFKDGALIVKKMVFGEAPVTIYDPEGAITEEENSLLQQINAQLAQVHLLPIRVVKNLDEAKRLLGEDLEEAAKLHGDKATPSMHLKVMANALDPLALLLKQQYGDNAILVTSKRFKIFLELAGVAVLVERMQNEYLATAKSA